MTILNQEHQEAERAFQFINAVLVQRKVASAQLAMHAEVDEHDLLTLHVHVMPMDGKKAMRIELKLDQPPPPDVENLYDQS